VYFKGERVDRLAESQWGRIRRHFGFLFQMGALFDSMTSGENIAFPLMEHSDYKADEIEEIVSQKLEMVGLDGIQNSRPADLSGGQRKRVALARALALNPEIILYDEPTTGLDPIRADSINDLINKLKDELSVTSVVVTHDMTSAFKVADRILMLQKGEFIADGTADDFRNADDPRVRQFIAGEAHVDVDASSESENRV
jgi:phospholipid/cholesterol/gamma-HCH transport system ATP-binding protein